MDDTEVLKEKINMKNEKKNFTQASKRRTLDVGNGEKRVIDKDMGISVTKEKLN